MQKLLQPPSKTEINVSSFTLPVYKNRFIYLVMTPYLLLIFTIFQTSASKINPQWEKWIVFS